jgi:hypothetical protein
MAEEVVSICAAPQFDSHEPRVFVVHSACCQQSELHSIALVQRVQLRVVEVNDENADVGGDQARAFEVICFAVD